MLKGTVSLLLTATVVWIFWMTYQWLRNPENRTSNRKPRKNLKAEGVDFLLFFVYL